VSAREEILNRLRTQLRGEASPPVWRSEPSALDRAARFTESLTAVGGEVRRAESLESGLCELTEILREVGARAVVANNEPPLCDVRLAERWAELEWHVVGQAEADLREFAVRADVGLSGAEAAIAETGSIVVRSGPERSRLATLLPPVHVAMVPESSLLSDLFEWSASFVGEMPANLTLISGPSKSADIEFELTFGIHGPKRLIVVLYGDEPPQG
jgi:L-lactate utilization protein LutC